MKTAVISDVHSNSFALECVVADARSMGASELWFLGDLFGYGPLPTRTWQLWQTYQSPRAFSRVISLPGNHDLGLMGEGDEAIAFVSGVGAATSGLQHYEMIEVAADSLRRNRKALNGAVDFLVAARAWVESAPLIVSPRVGIYLAHGNFDLASRAVTVGDYLQVMAFAEHGRSALLTWLQQGAPATANPVALDGTAELPTLLLVGHTHYQMAWRRMPEGNGGRVWEALLDDFGLQPGGRLGLEPVPPAGGSAPIEIAINKPLIDEDAECTTVVNPGSVGFPRDGARAGQGLAWAKYALIDWGLPGGRLAFRWVPYEVGPLIEKCQELGYPTQLARWLGVREGA